MEVLGVIGVLIGIFAGLIAVGDKLMALLPKKAKTRRKFKALYQSWVESGHHSLPKHDEYRAVVGAAFAPAHKPEESAFALICALQHGDQSMHDLIRANASSPIAANHTIGILVGRGTRVGWRAEYALSRLAPDNVHPALDRLIQSDGTSETVREAARRAKDGATVEYLKELARGSDGKLRSHAKEVLAQVGSDIQRPGVLTGPVDLPARS